MNHSLASILLPCVALIFIASPVIILQIDTLGNTDSQNKYFTDSNDNNFNYSRNRRSNQNDQTNTTIQTNNQLQQYNPSKPTSSNNVHHQAPNISQTPSASPLPTSSITSTPSFFNQSSSINSNLTSASVSPSPSISSTNTYSSLTHTTSSPFCHNNMLGCHQQCHGRSVLNKTRGYITDGHGNYSINVQCTWLIDSGTNNSTIRLRFTEFDTECNYDYLYIFDGNSIYSPLVAAFSGFLKPTQTIDNINKQYSRKNTLISANTLTSDISNNSSAGVSINTTKDDVLTTEITYIDEIIIKSGKAFIYFHSDTAQSMPGFNLTYTIDSCPYDCSAHGSCDLNTLKCNCDPGFKGEGCQIEVCPNNCSMGRQSGSCDRLQEKCICTDGYSGADCSQRTDQGVWTLVNTASDTELELEGRSFHQAVVVDDSMWVISGKTAPLTNFNSKNHWSNIIDRYDIISKRWEADRQRAKVGQDNLAELFGHTAISHNKKILIYGGMLPNSTISNTLIVFDTISMMFEPNSRASFNDKGKKIYNESQDEEDFVAPLAVVGHSATLVGHYMYIFFGYNPLYGFLDVVQKYNIIDSTWTIVETKGSSVDGTIGHSSVYDEASKMILVYGGHHSYKSNSLYSYDPSQDIWRLLQPGPQPRYYHRSIIVNGLMLVIGGNSYNSTTNLDANDDCFDRQTFMYDLNCVSGNHYLLSTGNYNNDMSICDNNCWQVINDPTPGVLQRYGHSVIEHKSSFYLFGGFNGLMLNTLHQYNIPDCLDYSNEKDCKRPKLALKCDWNRVKKSCHPANPYQKQQLFNQPKDSSLIQSVTTSSPTNIYNQDNQCSLKLAQSVCESRLTCKDCLYTNFGCRWCGNGQCRADKCKSLALNTKAIVDPFLCHSDETTNINNTSSNFLPTFSPSTFTYKETITQTEKDIATEIECRRYVNCYLCHTKSYCSWQSDHHHQICAFLPAPKPLPTPITLHSQLNTASLVSPIEQQGSSSTNQSHLQSTLTTPSPINNLWKHVFDSTFQNSTLSMVAMLNALGPSISMTPAPYQQCESPCFRRKSCKECIANKCIWCDTSNECIDSSAYFAYYPIGQCMHYVAHLAKCQGTSCSDIETCDQCQKNPKCGWDDDGTGRGSGQCLEGSSSGPLILSSSASENISTSLAQIETQDLFIKPSKWYFYNCPLCQCNGHSTCRPGTNICQKSCTGHTEGNHCEKCIPGYYGNPINGGICRECKCNNHASSCNKETGKCHCSTKGIIGHSCNKCDEQNHYLGDPTSPNDGTCYYNLTTDYQYTFNMSKADDYFYSDINFMNVPMKRDIDVDFTIVCSSLALVNITSGTYGLSYRYSTLLRRSLHTGLECGSFRLKFPYDEHLIGGGSNYTFYVHVYRFQTPFVLQIAFSQHRTLDLWQFFFTFSSFFLFLFVMAGVVWKLKQKYDLYRRRQQHVIEMEQMASRPFATILLELTGGFGSKSTSSVDLKLTKHVHNSDDAMKCTQVDNNDLPKVIPDHGDNDVPRSSRSASRVSLDKFHEVDYHKLIDAPSPISIEPCASGKAGILSLFVQLPGRPNLAIGSALVSLGDDSSSTSSNNLGNPYSSNSNNNKTGS